MDAAEAQLAGLRAALSAAEAQLDWLRAALSAEEGGAPPASAETMARENINKEYSSLKKENCKYQQIIENIQKWQETHAEHFNYKIGLELSLIIKKK